jgi:hypothetical protein
MAHLFISDILPPVEKQSIGIRNLVLVKKDDLENPTLSLKLSAILKQPWNRELLEESVALETIRRLRGTAAPESSAATGKKSKPAESPEIRPAG